MTRLLGMCLTFAVIGSAVVYLGLKWEVTADILPVLVFAAAVTSYMAWTPKE